MRFKKIIAFFAHPDDETLAMGGSLNKFKSEGCEIFVTIPCTGINARRNKQNIKKRKKSLSILKSDCLKALKYLGIKKNNIFFGKFSDNEIDNHSLLSLTHWFENILEKIKPDTVFTHHRFCTNIDHRYCHEAAVLATRPIATTKKENRKNRRTIFPSPGLMLTIFFRVFNFIYFLI